MLTVKLTKTRLIDPQDDGSSPVVNRACWASVSPILLNLTVPARNPDVGEIVQPTASAWLAAERAVNSGCRGVTACSRSR